MPGMTPGRGGRRRDFVAMAAAKAFEAANLDAISDAIVVSEAVVVALTAAAEATVPLTATVTVQAPRAAIVR